MAEAQVRGMLNEHHGHRIDDFLAHCPSYRAYRIRFAKVTSIGLWSSEGYRVAVRSRDGRDEEMVAIQHK